MKFQYVLLTAFLLVTFAAAAEDTPDISQLITPDMVIVAVIFLVLGYFLGNIRKKKNKSKDGGWKRMYER